MISPSLPQLQNSLASLSAAVHILDSFTHRNKNQHRGTKWWGALNTLRRHLHKLLPDLEGAVQRAELLGTASSTTSAKKRKKTLAAGGGDTAARTKQKKQPELDRVVERAAWARDVVAPRAFAAFTQLTTDKQFAQLGLVLVGVLAQVEAAIKPFVSAEPESGDDEAVVAPVQPTREEPRAQHKAVSRAPFPDRDHGGGGSGPDLGVAVSRVEVEGRDGDEKDRIRPSVERGSSPAPRPSSKKTDQGYETKIKKRKEREEVEGGSSKIKAGTKSRLPAGTKEVKSVKQKKKRKGGGDEFDNLFSSLL